MEKQRTKHTSQNTKKTEQTNKTVKNLYEEKNK